MNFNECTIPTRPSQLKELAPVKRHVTLKEIQTSSFVTKNVLKPLRQAINVYMNLSNKRTFLCLSTTKKAREDKSRFQWSLNIYLRLCYGLNIRK